MTVTNYLKQLYETDDDLWLLETIELLKKKQFNELDLDHLIEELDDLGSEKKKAVESFLEQIIRHLLLLEYWTEESPLSGNHWKAEIRSFRKQLNRRLTTNLHHHLSAQMTMIYQDALEYVTEKVGFTVNFPTECPYILEQLLDENYLPENVRT